MSVRFIPLANINGKPGAKGDKGDTGTFAGATAVSVPAGDPAEVSLSGPESAKVANFKIPRGLPGTNAVANDEAFATYINAVDSDTRDALEGVFVPKDAQVFFTADHGILGDGSTDDTIALQSLIDNVPAGAVIRGEPGAVIRTQGMEVPSGKSVHLDFSESTLVKAGEAPIVRAVGTYDVTQSVGAVTNGRTASTATVVDGSAFSVGDKVKIFSNDVVPGTRDPGDGRRSYRGEFATIVEITGNDLSLSPILYDSYSTNIRIARIVQTPFSLRFGEAYAEAGTGSGWGYPMFIFRSMYRPRIEGYISGAYSTGIGVQGCFGAYTNVWGENLPRDSGYVVVSGASVSGEHHIRAGRCRHAYTDSNPMIELPSNDPADFGRPMYDQITGSSNGDDGHPWDTHHGGVGHVFHGILAAGVRGAPAFMLRGEQHSLIDCTAIGADAGFQIFEEADGVGTSYSYGHMIKNFTALRCGTPFNVVNGKGPTAGAISATIEGGLFEGTVGHVRIEQSHVRINGAVIRHTGEVPPATGGGWFVNVVNGSLYGQFTLEAPNITGGTIPYVLRGSTLSTGTNNIDVDLTLHMSDTARHSTGAIVQWNTTQGQVRCRVIGNHSIPNPSDSLTLNAARQSVILTNTLSNVARTTAFQAPTPSNGTPITIQSGDPMVTVRVNASSAVTLGAIGVGAFSGQLLTIYPRGAGAVTVPNGGPFNTALGGDVTLDQGDVLRLVWDSQSNLWVKI